jgi:dienelactone hydrolase
MKAFRFFLSLTILALLITAESQASVQLFAPSDKGSYPGVIVLHTSGGLYAHETDYARSLRDRGYVVAVVNYFAKGGVDNIDRAYDALRNHPSVGNNRIGMVGFSLGARVAMERTTYYHSSDKREIYAIVSYYIGPQLGFANYTAPPTLFLQGEFDVYVKPLLISNHCVSQNKAGITCEVIEYKGIKHAFDQARTKYDGYDKRTEDDAFRKTVNFLGKYLRSDEPVKLNRRVPDESESEEEPLVEFK